MAELLLDIMAKMNVESVSFCLNDIIPLLVCSQVKVEKSQVRKVVQECWKLTPAPNGLTYTAYQYGGNDRYQTRRSRGSNRGERRYPPAGRTDFRPADRQGKALIAGETKKATNVC